jgi:sugar lactone lactonase YvrE
MKSTFAAAACAAALATLSTIASADERGPFPRNATFSTLAVTPLAIEGLTADGAGNLYTTGRELIEDTCPVWRFTGGTRTTVGFIPNPPAARCNPSGIAFDSHGNLYIADGGPAATIWKLTPDATTPPLGAAFATGVPGTNGLAFDRDGNLWTGDGTTGNGRVWRIDSAGGVDEVFRIQPMANSAGVGRSNGTLQPASAAPNPQPLVANGLAFTPEGELYVADTARGAIWKVEFDRRGNLKSRTGCDTTFTGNTLCLDHVFVAHPSLEGTDGIALDRAGNIWNSANERNAVVVVTRQGEVKEAFRNPVNPATGLRNSGPDNTRILELPTSPVLAGDRFCTANSDGNRRDNSPNSAGEVNQGGAVGARGKISCMDQALEIPGLRLPVR